MTQLSKYPLEKSLEIRVHEILDDALASLTTREEIEQFLGDLLSPTEKLMLAKRLSIALLLEKGFDYREITKILKVSSSTIGAVAVWRKIRGRGYKRVIDKLLQIEKWNKVVDGVTEYLKMSLSNFGPYNPLRKFK